MLIASLAADLLLVNCVLFVELGEAQATLRTCLTNKGVLEHWQQQAVAAAADSGAQESLAPELLFYDEYIKRQHAVAAGGTHEHQATAGGAGMFRDPQVLRCCERVKELSIKTQKLKRQPLPGGGRAMCDIV